MPKPNANLHRLLCDGLPALFEFDGNAMPDGSIRLFTPFMFRDGTMPVIFLTERNGQYILTDGCETLGWLWQQSVSGELSPQQKYLLDQICRSALGVEHHKGELTLRCTHPEQLAGAVFRLGQAMLHVSNLWFLEPTSTPGIESGTAE